MTRASGAQPPGGRLPYLYYIITSGKKMQGASALRPKGGF
nr:MAG TPA: hypothetical protein [Caudoviricetes sp.]